MRLAEVGQEQRSADGQQEDARSTDTQCLLQQHGEPDTDERRGGG